MLHVLAAQKILDESTRDDISGQTFFITNDSPTYFGHWQELFGKMMVTLINITLNCHIQ